MPIDSISTAVQILLSSPDSSDDEVFGTLVSAGIERKYAARLVEFIPIVYCRLLLTDSGPSFSDMFQRRTPSGEVSANQPLSSEPVWIEISDYAKAQANRGLSKDEWMRLAGRSAEFDAINRMLNQGSKLTDITLSSVLLKWSAEDPQL